MSRRAAGIGAIKNKNLAHARFKDKGTELASEQISQLSKQLDAFKGNLEEFASKHRSDIKKNPEFRNHFQEMCAAIGVDPLASGKGFWSKMLGVGDFYYELGVQIIEVCLATNQANGGLICVHELRHRLRKSRGKKSQDISINDILTAIRKLKSLGNGFTVLPLGHTWLVQSVPSELNMDHTIVIQHAQDKCYITLSEIEKDLSWDEERAKRTVNYLVSEGLVWIDEQAKPESQYWFPGIFSNSQFTNDEDAGD